MKRKERQQNFHESLINMLYTSPSPSQPPHPNQFDDQTLNFAREIVNSNSHHINTDELEEEEDKELSSSSEEEGFQKLTRAQRKRLRRKKLKEAGSLRREIIGPLLPPIGDDLIDGDEIERCPDGVRQIAEERRPEGVRQNAEESRPEDARRNAPERCLEGARQNAVERGLVDAQQNAEERRLEGILENAEVSRPEGVRLNTTETPRGETLSCIKVKHRRMSKKLARDKPETAPSSLSDEAANNGAQN